MSHDTEIIRELLFVKKHLSNITDVAYSFEMRDRSSSDGEPVLPKILRKIKQKDYKMKEMEDVRFFLLSLLEHVFEDTCVCVRQPIHFNSCLLRKMFIMQQCYRIDNRFGYN